jgi:hypothetical protein
LGYGQLVERHQSRHDEEQGKDRRKDRTVDEKSGKSHSLYSFL